MSHNMRRKYSCRAHLESLRNQFAYLQNSTILTWSEEGGGVSKPDLGLGEKLSQMVVTLSTLICHTSCINASLLVQISGVV